MYKRREPVLKICKHCKTEYMSNHLRQKYCSSSCCTLAFYKRNGTEPIKKRSQSLEFNLNNLGVIAAGSAISTSALELFKENETKLSKKIAYELGRIEAKIDALSDITLASTDITLDLNGDDRVKQLYSKKLKVLQEKRKNQVQIIKK